MSQVTGFKDTTLKDKKVPSCWAGIEFSDGIQCQISVAHRVFIYSGRTMIGGKFYDAEKEAILRLLANWLSKDELWALSRGRLGLLRGKRTEPNELLEPPVDGMNHPLLIAYTNLALDCDSVEEFKELLNDSRRE